MTTTTRAAPLTTKSAWRRRIAKLLMVAQLLYPMAGLAPNHARETAQEVSSQGTMQSLLNASSTLAFEDYTLYTLSSTTSHTQLVTSAPAKLLAGRDLSLIGGTVNNLDSQIVAGRNLFASGANVNNVATPGTSTTTVSGTAQFSHVDSCGTFGGSHCRNTDGAVAYNPAPTTTHPDLATVVYPANAAHPTGTQDLSGSSTSADPRIAGYGLTALQGVQVQAQGGITVQGGDVSISGAVGSDKTSVEHSTHGTKIGASLWHDLGKGINAERTETNTDQNTGLVRSTLAGSSVSISATGGNGASGDITLAGTKITAPVVNLSAANDLNLNVQTTQSLTDHSVQGRDLGWQAMGSKGQSSDKVAYNQIETASLNVAAKTISVQVAQPQAAASAPSAAPGRGTAIDPKGFATAQPVLTPAQQLQATVDTLKTQPGMAWMGQLQSDPALQDKVNWAAVTQAHDSWDYQHQGLTKEGAAIVTVVVAYFTAGAASGLASSAGAAAGDAAFVAGASAATAATVDTAVVGAMTAAVSTLASQAAVALINNKGDIGAALHDMGSSENVKGLVASIVTGGVLAGLNMNPTGGATAGSGADKFLTQLGQSLKAGAAKAVINTAIYGNSLEDNLRSELKGALISTAAAQTANAIGDAKFDTVTNKLAHAIAGCAAGAATTGNGSGCSAGALGASIGEISAELYGSRSDTVQFASMVSGIAAGIAGQDVNVAAAAGGNAAANNYLNHTQAAVRERLKDKQRSGQALTASEQKTLDSLEILDIAKDLVLREACKVSGDACNAARRDFNASLASYAGAGAMYDTQLSAAGNAGVTAERNQDLALATDPTLASQSLLDSFKEFAIPQAAGYVVGAALGAYINEARAIYGAIKIAGSEAAAIDVATVAVRNGEVVDSAGRVLARQNPVTGAYEAAVALPVPSNSGGAAGTTSGAPALASNAGGTYVGPWSNGVRNIVESGTFTQCGNGSCVSATAQVLTNGAVSEAQVLAKIGEWADPLRLPGVLNELAPAATPWRGGYFGTAEDALAVASRGPMGAVLRAPGEAGHMVTISPVEGSSGWFRVQDTGVGKTYDVPSAWIKQFVAGGVWK